VILKAVGSYSCGNFTWAQAGVPKNMAHGLLTTRGLAPLRRSHVALARRLLRGSITLADAASALGSATCTSRIAPASLELADPDYSLPLTPPPSSARCLAPKGL